MKGFQKAEHFLDSITSYMRALSLKLAILGGGLTGLTIGTLLKQQKIDFEIIEKEKECGGLMRSVQVGGYTFDYGGSHIIFSKNQRAVDFLIGSLADNKIKVKRNTKILYKNKFVKYPFENGLSDLSISENYECLLSFIENLMCEKNKPTNLKDWFYFTFGKGITDKYLLPYNEKIWKIDPQLLGLEWVERIPSPPIEDIIKSSLGIETEGYTHQLFFFYPKTGGIQEIIRSLESRIHTNITTNYNVKKIRKEGKMWIITDGITEKKFSDIVCSMPIQELVPALNATKQVKEAVKKLKYNSLITVMIGLKKEQTNAISWLYIPDRKILAHRVSYPSNFSPEIMPVGKSSVLAEITCLFEDNIWQMSDEEIINIVTEDLEKCKILRIKDICVAEVKRTKYAYVLNTQEYSNNLLIINNFMAKIGIDLAGRFAEFKYLNMDACVESAFKYVEKKRRNI